MKTQLTHRKTTPIKKRAEGLYKEKVEKITKWYNQLLENRKIEVKINPHNKLPYKRAELKPLSYYVDKIKKANT